MAKLQVGQVVDLTTLSKLEAKIGTIVESLLDYTTFSDENLGIWYPLDGRSCVGTTYGTLMAKTVVPDATTDGAFFRQAKAGRDLGSAEDHATASPTNPLTGTAASNGAHTHSITGTAASAGSHNHTFTKYLEANSGGSYATGTSNGSVGPSSTTTSSDGAHTHSVSGTAASNGAHTHTVSVNGGGDAETRPINIAVNLFIKVGY